jgi:TRAP-type C4-dicarboxylate transport system substrate-binding protein
MEIDRRAFIAGISLGPLAVHMRAASGLDEAAQPRSRTDYSFVQYHNQTESSSLHKRLVEMWEAVRQETNGRIETRVLAQNNNIPGSDPAALKMLVAGEIHFFTLMGGILGTVVPVAEVQQVPFAFRSAAHAHRAMDGPLGAYIRAETEAKGIYGFPVAAFDNGMRQIGSTTRPVRVPSDRRRAMRAGPGDGGRRSTLARYGRSTAGTSTTAPRPARSMRTNPLR